ncbi:hypothetical protein VaNZ11_000766 [Volvox africanus]|uniref:EF-hand domain-containing protein n=1 Tax=Volvox africanus TaxID=51714 RepID=A0ABQ5RND9_9CHLO|nr:hypothetical protein VaNZ11_000766 [Volvox africanus]
MDKDSNGHISVVELQAALAEGGLNFSLGTTASIIRQCNNTRTGTITFDVFERLHAFLATVQDTFERMRPDSRTGRVSFEEVARTLAALDYRLEPQVRDALFIRFDPLQAHSMGMQEFMALTLFLRSATETFKAFDPADTGVVHLNFTQFLYAAVNSN